MFAVKTDHAANQKLGRDIPGYITWWNHALNLAWLGFADAHSNITHYFINIGSTYMAADLNYVRVIQ